MNETIISPSVLAIKGMNYKEELKRLDGINNKYLHFDVMDTEFIGHTSFSFDDYKEIKSLHNFINDVHLMVKDPYKYSIEYIKMGVEIITFHYEALNSNFERLDLINFLKSKNIKVGISIKPKTDVNEILPFLKFVDQVLIMSVEPGLGGQKFMESALTKIQVCREYINKNNLNVDIEVDGGINDITGPLCIKAGANILVAGTYLFKAINLKENYKKLFGENNG